jgi:hypothetical protein
MLADSRTFCIAGNRMPIKMAMIKITTSNSMSVKARRQRDMVGLQQDSERRQGL